jgi:hypothetical protein
VAPVTVEIADVAELTEPRGAELRYLVRNGSGATIWVVDDRWFAWRLEDGRIELNFARTRMQPGVEPFGYFAPEVVAVEPGAGLERTVALIWPHTLSGMWNADAVADPSSGEYEVVVRVGWADSPAPRPPETADVEAPVLAWQREAVSGPARLVVR